MNGQAGHFYEFGPFRVDATKRLLLRDGQAVQLTPKAFDTLIALIQNRGRVLEKDELLKMLWPDSFVEEGNLTVNISVLRKALGESAGRHQFIVTIPGKGYRFVADVVESVDESAELVMEKRTLSQTVRLEEEDLILPDEAQALEGVGQKGLESGGAVRVGHVWERSGAALALSLLVVGLSGAVLYFWMSGRVDERGKVTSVKSVAVLPFKTLDAAAAEDHLGIGIADTLITRLSGLRQVAVRPTSAILRYSEGEYDSVAAGQALQVEGVLEGSIQRVGDRVRITARLLSARDGASLWAGKFDEKSTDLLAVQDSISEQVTQALALNLSSDERRSLTKHHTDNVKAYNLYLKGRYFWNRRTEENFEKAIEYFEQAIRIDPNYALAYAGLADAYSLFANGSDSKQEREERYKKAKAAAFKALEIDETLAEAHTSLGWIKRTHEWDWPGAEAEFKRAIELNPNSADAHQWYALLLTTLGRTEEAIAEIERAQELNPISLAAHANAAAVFFFARQFDRAIAYSQAALELDPNDTNARRNLAMNYVQKGMYEEAIAEVPKIGSSQRSTTLSALLARAYARSGQKEKAQEVLNGLHNLAKQQTDGSFYLATVYGDLGEKDKAFDLLQQAYDAHEDRLVWIKVDPRLDGLRSDPRFQDLLRRMGLAPSAG